MRVSKGGTILLAQWSVVANDVFMVLQAWSSLRKPRPVMWCNFWVLGLGLEEGRGGRACQRSAYDLDAGALVAIRGQGMFWISPFNQDIGGWDTSRVGNMEVS